jgi:hypothetical protein
LSVVEHIAGVAEVAAEDRQPLLVVGEANAQFGSDLLDIFPHAACIGFNRVRANG